MSLYDLTTSSSPVENFFVLAVLPEKERRDLRFFHWFFHRCMKPDLADKVMRDLEDA